MFERQGASGYKEGLSNTLALDRHFDHPHQAFATIHVGGTNGKGSVSHTIASVLQQCGYSVGLYTSPHLVDFRERIRVNGQPVSEDFVTDFVNNERAFFEPLHPSFFEVTTAMAFKYFKEKEIDIAIVEVGLGGRLDCTNIITPIASVITNISFDHTQFLGDTLAKIAAEKAGIIKEGVPAIIGESNKDTRPVFEARCREVGAPVIFAEDQPEVISADITDEGGMHYVTRHFGELHGDLGGIYQQKNLNTVLKALKTISEKGYLSLKADGASATECPFEIKEGIAHVAEQTGLMGRWQIVSRTPLTICDTGHNVGGWQYLSRQLNTTRCNKKHIVFGMVDDKDIKSVLQLLPNDACYYFTKADNHRALNEHSLQKLAMAAGLNGKTYPSVNEAYNAAKKSAATDDLIFVGGSSYVVGDFLKSCV